MTAKNGDPQITVPALEKALDILEYAAIYEGADSVKEIAEALDIAPASAFRIVGTLVKRGYIVRGEDGMVKPGPRNALLHKAYLTSSDLRESARPYMQRLLRETQETVELADYEESNHDLTFLEVLDSTRSISIKFTRKIGVPLIGSTNPITLVTMAWLEPSERDALLDRMETTRACLLHLEPVLEKFPFEKTWDPECMETIREQGYWADFGVQTPDVTRVAAPVFSDSGRIAGTLGIAGPVFYLRPDSSEESIERVIEAARELSVSLGYTPKTVRE
jgi:DNA-binding IclR family transcriptional regulator